MYLIKQGTSLNDLKSSRNYSDIFIAIMWFALLLHLLIENFKSESYCFERNNRMGSLNDYSFELYQTTLHNSRPFNCLAIFVVYK